MVYTSPAGPHLLTSPAHLEQLQASGYTLAVFYRQLVFVCCRRRVRLELSGHVHTENVCWSSEREDAMVSGLSRPRPTKTQCFFDLQTCAVAPDPPVTFLFFKKSYN